MWNIYRNKNREMKLGDSFRLGGILMIKKHDFLWLAFFLIILINGFEAGGYQASLLNIGKDYDLSNTSKGLFASVELFATMLAPLFLGAWADRNNKINCLKIILFIQILAASLITLINLRSVFIVGVFFLGLSTSALQFITIAALADSYPLSYNQKIGFLTSMYALGAFIAPLIVSVYLKIGLSWKTLFLLIALASVFAFLGLTKSNNYQKETVVNPDLEGETSGNFIILAIICLCVIMCIYVGFENGFAFFIDSLFAQELNSNLGKYALSLFWIIMIPARVLVGYLGKYSKIILLICIISIPTIILLITNLINPIGILLLCIPLGFASGAIYPSVLNIAMPLAGSKKATATGMITTATGIGGVCFTALTGFVGGQYNLRIAILVLAAFFLISLIALLILIRITKKLT